MVSDARRTVRNESPPMLTNEAARPKFDETRKLLVAAAEAYHAAHEGTAPDRVEQFDRHMTTLLMVIDHTEHHVVNVVPNLPSGEESADAPHYLEDDA